MHHSVHCEVTDSIFPGAVALASGLFAGRLSTHLTDIGCNGSEHSLLSCSITLSEQCISNQDAAVVCQGRCVIVLFPLSPSCLRA